MWIVNFVSYGYWIMCLRNIKVFLWDIIWCFIEYVYCVKMFFLDIVSFFIGSCNVIESVMNECNDNEIMLI